MKYIGIGLLFFAAVFVVAVVMALPMMWLCNYLFSPSFLMMVFGVPQLTFWKAFCLSGFLGIFVNSNSSK